MQIVAPHFTLIVSWEKYFIMLFDILTTQRIVPVDPSSTNYMSNITKLRTSVFLRRSEKPRIVIPSFKISIMINACSYNLCTFIIILIR